MTLTEALSPYTGCYATLRFGDGLPLSIPASLLDKHRELSSRCEWDMSLNLETIPGDLGHVLVHHLLTGTYQCLKPKGSSPLEKSAAEYATSVRVYAIAQEYELPTLEKLAKGEMERLGRCLTVTQLLDVVTDAHPATTVDDTWFHNHLKSLVEPLMNNPLISLINDPSEHSGQTVSLASVLLRAMISLWHKKVDATLLDPWSSMMSQCDENPFAVIPLKNGPACNPELEQTRHSNPLLKPEVQGTLDLEKEAGNWKQKGNQVRRDKLERFEEYRLPTALGSVPVPARELGPSENAKERDEKEKGHPWSVFEKTDGVQPISQSSNGVPMTSLLGSINLVPASITTRNDSLSSQPTPSTRLFRSSDITRNQHGIGTVPSTMGADIYIHHKVREGAGSSDDNVCTGGELYKHDVPKYNICNTCGTYCDSPSDLKKHLKTHVPKTTQCFGCDVVFISDSAMVLHLEAGACESGANQNWITAKAFECYQSSKYAFFDTPDFNFKCPSCDTPFALISAVLQHVESDYCNGNLTLKSPLRKFLRFLATQFL